MPIVTFVIGLCGSGKSFHVDRLSKARQVSVFESIVEKNEFDLLFEKLREGHDCVVEEISFCWPDNRQLVIEDLKERLPDVRVEWFCLENDLAAANWNVVNRTNPRDTKRQLKINAQVSAAYSYPDGCEPVPVFRIPEKPMR